MLTVTFFKDSHERLSSISADGHAQWDDEGQDIVCAAVSAILQAARLGLEQHARALSEAHQTKGHLHLSWPADKRGDPAVAAIADTARLAIERIAGDYPDYVRYAIRRLEE
ncbi:MAG: ribosomal-processing cysteine protease Prp [Candidatus Eremiobacteraeota bacterium]|nr:ribosomal-processing cysteine protease Prp [Candidatus Eremiobacteraeota bacterium]MBV9736725.1 ribosomal-processing cysteine protease Prp [Candidatus Eremiobacteraeota bacterium]